MFKEVSMVTELMMPGASLILNWATEQKEKLNLYMTRMNCTPLATRVSQEMFALLMDKTVVKARQNVELLETWEGLEAWRTITLNLDKPDPQRDHEEYTKLTSLEPISSNDFKDFTAKITKWEAMLLKYERIDPEVYRRK